jgi:hypothetical protein
MRRMHNPPRRNGCAYVSQGIAGVPAHDVAMRPPLRFRVFRAVLARPLSIVERLWRYRAAIEFRRPLQPVPILLDSCVAHTALAGSYAIEGFDFTSPNLTGDYLKWLTKCHGGCGKRIVRSGGPVSSNGLLCAQSNLPVRRGAFDAKCNLCMPFCGARP